MKITEGKNNIAWLGSDFKKHFSYNFKEKETKLVSKTLGTEMNDKEIKDKFHPEPIELGEMMNFLKTADHSGWYIFYVQDEEKTLWAVGAHWRSSLDGWRVDAGSVEDPYRWYAVSQVVSRRFLDTKKSKTLSTSDDLTLKRAIRMVKIHLEDHNLDTVIMGKATRCRGCPTLVYWALMPNANHPLPVHQNEHGLWVDHFNDCPNAEIFKHH